MCIRDRKKSNDLSLVVGVASSGAGGVGRVDVESAVVAIGSPTKCVDLACRRRVGVRRDPAVSPAPCDGSGEARGGVDENARRLSRRRAARIQRGTRRGMCRARREVGVSAAIYRARQ